MSETLKKGLREIALKDIRTNPIALRDVDQGSEEFQGLIDSVHRNGVLNAVVVRVNRDPNTDTPFYELVDGLHRFMASKAASQLPGHSLKIDSEGNPTIPCNVRDFDEDSLLEAQIICNIHRVETKPSQYSDQLKRIIVRNPNMTETDLANRVGKSLAWVQARLSLNRIENKAIQDYIDSGKISLSNAYALARLPVDEQAEWVERAMGEDSETFNQNVKARLKQINEAKRRGKDAPPPEFIAQPHSRTVREIHTEVESGEAAMMLCTGEDGMAPGTEDAQAGFIMGLRWAIQIDPRSVLAQEEKFLAKQRQIKEDRERRKQERAAKRALEARKAEDRARKEAEEAGVDYDALLSEMAESDEAETEIL